MEKKSRVRKPRSIDQGTYYDITGKMRKLERDIERGEHGEVTDVVLVMRHKTRNGVEYTTYGWGAMERSEHHFMMCVGQRDILG